MNNATPAHWQSVASLSKLIHAGALSPLDLMEELLERVERLNPKLAAFRLVPRERALGAARAAQQALDAGEDWGPLHGIPFAAKDIIDVRGLVTSAGSNALADVAATHDAHVITMLRRAGMVLLGKSNTVQFAMGAPGINHHHGTPHNPWSPIHHVPGGSSNGSAVAVAAGLVPMALGTDTGGSVRIPAALCGTVGLKTTVGQVSRAGVFPLSLTLDSVGPLTRTVEDAALTYQVMHGVDARDRSTENAVGSDVLGGLRRGVRGLRVGIVGGIFNEDIDPEIAAAVQTAANVLSDLGAQVERLDLPEAAEALAANPRRIISSIEGCYAHECVLGSNFEGYDPALAQRIADGRRASGIDYLRALEARISIAARAEQTLADVDVFLAPTTAYPAKPLTQVDACPDDYNEWNRRYARNTSIGNLLGLCALSVPCGVTKDGLPIGLMIHAKPRDEAMALRVGFAYEQATQWHELRPDLAWADNA
ncbi:MAG: aspartyl-tRNA(Asn)/glutamyl-tRNA(Gln) amidotransferase subunit A [Gammaproteobacteria bacterium]